MVNEGEDYSRIKIGKEKSLLNNIKKPKIAKREAKFHRRPLIILAAASCCS